jgi:Uri superfamily endonuclease
MAPYRLMDAPDLGSIHLNLERLAQRNRDVAVGFIYTELASGLLSCRFLRDTQIIPERKRAWHLDYAMKALEHAEAAMWKLKLSHPEFDQMMALAERLRFEVDSFKRL